MKSFQFNSKAKTLNELKKFKLNFIIPKFLVFTVKEWNFSKEKVFKNFFSLFKKQKIIIRSSSIGEDKENYSGAGKYQSIVMKSHNKENIKKNILKIIKDYKIKDKKNYLKNEIIIQEYISNISMSGVAFTHDIETGSPYYVINYDDKSKKTESVTSGTGEHANKKLYIYRKSTNKIRSLRFKKLVKCISNLEKTLNKSFLDVEFAVDKNFIPYLFQVRPISSKNKWLKIDEKKISKYFNLTKLKIKNTLKEKTILAQMPDWNPAEIIGERPDVMSFDLYKKLITDNSWIKARRMMGYKDKVDNTLMEDIAGRPFINTRLSFNSFIPKVIPRKIELKLIKYWLSIFGKNPNLHDKIEFEIAITSFDLFLPNRIKKIPNKILSIKEKNLLLKCYKDLTINAIVNNKFDKYKKKLEYLQNLDLNKTFEIKNLVRLLKNYGIIPFAIMARHAFISQSFLNSFVKKKIFTLKQSEEFQRSISTITKLFLSDMSKVASGNLSKKIFMKKYGHLRPGTYDIKSKRYDQMNNFSYKKNKIIHKKFNLTKKIEDDINISLQKNKILNLSARDLLSYITESIELREYSKFVFTRILSFLIEKIKEKGRSKKIEVSDLTFLKLHELDKNKKFLLKIIKKRQKVNQLQSKIKVPQIIFKDKDMDVVPYLFSTPNFVSSKHIIGKIVSIDNNVKKNLIIKNQIVLIKNADPGFDWIFSEKILGLITQYGGVNSHMAIRCSELDLPAIIGVGEKYYKELLKAKKIELNCKSKSFSTIL